MKPCRTYEPHPFREKDYNKKEMYFYQTTQPHSFNEKDHEPKNNKEMRPYQNHQSQPFHETDYQPNNTKEMYSCQTHQSHRCRGKDHEPHNRNRMSSIQNYRLRFFHETGYEPNKKEELYPYQTYQSQPFRDLNGHEDHFVSGVESSLLTNSQLSSRRKSGDQYSFRSGTSKSSINNPKLLKTVEDAIRRLILPELTILKQEQKMQQNRSNFEREKRDSGARYTIDNEKKHSFNLEPEASESASDQGCEYGERNDNHCETLV
jgi:hypothetical protein